jgi:hypothetical protein
MSCNTRQRHITATNAQATTFHFGWLLLCSILGESESCGNIYWWKLDKFSNVLRQKEDGKRTFARHAERWFGGEAHIFNLLSYRNDVLDLATTAVSYSSDEAPTIRSTAIFTSIPFSLILWSYTIRPRSMR